LNYFETLKTWGKRFKRDKTAAVTVSIIDVRNVGKNIIKKILKNVKNTGETRKKAIKLQSSQKYRACKASEKFFKTLKTLKKWGKNKKSTSQLVPYM